jgi:hypothetical protein
MLLILGVKLSLKVFGFARTQRWIRRRAESMPVRPVSGSEVAPVEHSVAMAAAVYPGRALCLEQSLVLYYLLRCGGAHAHFRIGVQPHPFLAHAWVEFAGRPINDVPEHVRWFAPLPDPLP